MIHRLIALAAITTSYMLVAYPLVSWGILPKPVAIMIWIMLMAAMMCFMVNEEENV